jgi:hypothetical protein
MKLSTMIHLHMRDVVDQVGRALDRRLVGEQRRLEGPGSGVGHHALEDERERVGRHGAQEVAPHLGEDRLPHQPVEPGDDAALLVEPALEPVEGGRAVVVVAQVLLA